MGYEVTVTRSPLRDALACLVCHKPGPDLEFDHIKERSTHPQLRDDPANIAPLCAGPNGCHWLKSNKRIKTWVVPANSGPSYRGVDVYCWKKRDSDVTIRVPVKVDTRHGCLVPREGAEPTDASSLELVERSAPSQATGGEDTALPVSASDRPVVIMDAGGEDLVVGAVPVRADRPTVSPSAFSRESWLSEGEQLLTMGLQLKNLTDEWRYRIGDWVATGEQNLGEEAYGHFSRFEDAFGASQLRQLGWVAASVTRVTRELAPSWSHARAVASLDVEAQGAALTTAREKGLSTRELSALIRPAPAERERHACPLCNFSHWVLVQEDWKA